MFNKYKIPTKDDIEKMKEKGVLISYDGQFSNVLKIRPPLVFEIRHAELLLTSLEESLEEINQ